MKKTLELKLMIIENFIDYFTSSENERERMKLTAEHYVKEDHVDEITQGLNLEKEVEVSRHELIRTLKKKFFGNDPESWNKNSNEELLEWYKEYILEDKTAKVALVG